MKQYTIIIEADTNDADCITQKSKITERQLELIKPVIKAIKEFKPYKGEWMPGQFTTHDHNFPYGECLREDMGEKSVEMMYGHLPGLELFMEFVPHDEYGIHTIESIELLEAGAEQKLL